MSGLNKVTLIGNIGKDPEITKTNNGLTIAKFSIATSDGLPDKNTGDIKTEWHRIVAFSKTAEYIEKYVKKGATACIEGRIQYGNYENKDGITVYTTDIICNNFINLTKRESGEYQQPTKNNPAPASFNVESDLTDDDLPF